MRENREISSSDDARARSTFEALRVPPEVAE